MSSWTSPDDDLERELRAALDEEARRIMPRDRFADIRTHTDGLAEVGRGRPDWLLPVAASFVVLLLGFGAWSMLRPPPPAQPGGATTIASQPTSASTPSASTGGPSSPATSSSSSSPSASSSSVPAGIAYSAPIYYVAPGTASLPWLLTRDFVPTTIAEDTPTRKAERALAVLVQGALPDGTALPYQGLATPWQPGTTGSVTVTPAEIQVRLERAGQPGLTVEQQRIAVQSIVWTVTAAVQDNKPVRIEVTGGGPIFESKPAGVYKRPAETWRDLAPIWITAPSRWAPAPAGQPVVAKGQATVFEANVSWQLQRADGSAVRSGTVMASVGAPERGEWSVDLGALPAGDYVLRAWEVSMKDGAVSYETRQPFRVG